MAINKEEYFSFITRNAAKCHECGEEIESKHRHDFRWCSCKNLAVDGGQYYLKRSIKNSNTWTDTSQYELMSKVEIETKIKHYLEMASEYKSPYYQEIAEFGTILLKEKK